MTHPLPYGNGCSLSLDWTQSLCVAECRLPVGESVVDAAAAARDALRQPLDYPPLQDALVPGDHVVVTVEPGVPQTPAIVAGVVRGLAAGGVSSECVTVLAATPLGEAPPDSINEEGLVLEPEKSWLLSALSDEERRGIQAAWHVPEAQGAVSYLAATDEADPVYVARRICDADLVIPIGVQRIDDTLGYLGAAGSLFPTFSDVATRRRLSPCDLRQWRKQRTDWRQEAAQAQWLLGVQFVVRVIPGRADSVLAVIAGQAEAAERNAAKRCRAAWRGATPHEADLVVAAIDGGESEQTWDNVARTLAMANRIVSAEGVIVLCTDLQQAPGPALRSGAAAAGGRRRTAREEERPVDVLPAAVLADLAQSHRLYLWSRLADDVVDEVGFTPVSTEDELARLSRGLKTCVVVSGGQFASVAVRAS